MKKRNKLYYKWIMPVSDNTLYKIVAYTIPDWYFVYNPKFTAISCTIILNNQEIVFCEKKK